MDEITAAQIVQWHLLKLAAAQEAGAIVALGEIMAAEVAETAALELDSIAMLVFVNRP